MSKPLEPCPLCVEIIRRRPAPNNAGTLRDIVADIFAAIGDKEASFAVRTRGLRLPLHHAVADIVIRSSAPLANDTGALREALVEEAARAAMRKTEVARTDVVKPVNGTAPYTVVVFHGQRTEFHDGEWTIEMHRDAGTGKAAAYAQAINNGLFELAKEAARKAAIRADKEKGAGQ